MRMYVTSRLIINFMELGFFLSLLHGSGTELGSSSLRSKLLLFTEPSCWPLFVLFLVQLQKVVVNYRHLFEFGQDFRLSALQ